jgi:hypothetical protein
VSHDQGPDNTEVIRLFFRLYISYILQSVRFLFKKKSSAMLFLWYLRGN